jgi:DNA polymerase III epsilon subunit-like protein
MRIRLALLLATFALLCPTAPAQRPPKDPAWVLAHIDVETTGLIPGHHEIVDIGVVYTDFEGNILDKWHRRVMPEHPERTEPAAAKINGFDPKVWKELGALSPRQALDEWLALEKEKFAGKTILRVAYNSKFDAAFLDVLFRAHGLAFDQPNYSYFWLDIPSMAWSLGYRELSLRDLAKRLGVKGTSDVPLEHTGLGCAEANVRVYRALVSIRKQQAK